MPSSSKLAATYLMLFLVMTDLGIVQNPMFGDGTSGSWAALLPGYGPSRVMVDGAFSPGFHTWGDLLPGRGLGRDAGAGGVYAVLQRSLGSRRPRPLLRA